MLFLKNKLLNVIITLVIPFIIVWRFPIHIHTTDTSNVSVKEIALGLEYDYNRATKLYTGVYTPYTFSDGLVGVNKDGMMGVIDKTGKLVIEAIFNGIYPFQDGFALANTEYGTKHYLIDKTGKIIRYYNYSMVRDFREGIAAVAEGYYDYLNAEPKWGYIDIVGNSIIPLEYDSAEFFSEGLAAVCKDGKWGYIDKTGKIVVPFEYDFAFPFSESFAIVGKTLPFDYTDIPSELHPLVMADSNYTFSILQIINP